MSLKAGVESLGAHREVLSSLGVAKTFEWLRLLSESVT